MKKMHILIFIASLALSLSLELISFLISLFARGSVFFFSSVSYQILSWVGFIIRPLLFFAAFYFIGKKVNLELELKSIILWLFAGIVLANLIVFGLDVLTFYHNQGVSILLGLASTIFWSFLSKDFFVALCALAIGYIRGIKRNNLPTANILPEAVRRSIKNDFFLPLKIKSAKMEIYCPKCGALFNSEGEMLEHFDREHEAVSGEGQ